MNSPLRIRINFLIMVIVPLIAGVIACKKMDDIKTGLCGNAVIEPGEDCDSFPNGEGTSCVPPGKENECRLSCIAADDGEKPKCPQGWGCGLDGICRVSSGSYALVGSATPVGAWSARTGDFDGDGKKDVLTLGPSDPMGKVRTRIHYFNDQAEISDSHTMTTLMASPLVVNLKSDASDDLVSGVHGIVSWNGSVDRKMLPSATSSIDFKTKNVRIIPINVSSSSGRYSWTMFIRADSEVGTIIDTNGATENIRLGDAELFNSLVSDPAKTVRLNESYCPSFILAFKGEKKISVFTPCYVSETGLEWNSDLGQITISLSDPVESGAAFTDINSDGFVDVIASVKTDSGNKIRIGYGNDIGIHFSSSPDAIYIPDDQLSSEFWSLTNVETQEAADVTSLPLESGWFGNSFGISFVFPTLMYVDANDSDPYFEGIPEYITVNEREHGAWSSAIISDINADWLGDVIVSSSEELDIGVFNLGWTINDRYSIPTLGPVSHMIVTDVDGDSLNDIVYSQTSLTGGRDALFVSYGQPLKAPTAPIKFAEFDSVAQIVPADKGVQVLSFPSDAGPDNQASVSQFIGTSDHQLLSQGFLYAEGRDYDVPLLVTVGELVKSSVDLFSIAYENNKSNFVYHSWAALANGGQIGKPQELADGGVPFLENESPALIANADLNGDGVAEIILASYFSATSGDSSSGRIRIGNISEVAADGLKWIDLSEIPLETPNLIPTLKGLLSANDLNGDGLADIVLATGNGALAIFWNNGNSQFDKPTFMAQEGVFAFALTHDQPDGPKTLVYTAGKSIVSSSFSKERTIEVHNLIDGLVAPTGITAGDYNGDGIEDIAVVDNQNLLMLRGNARKPGQTLK